MPHLTIKPVSRETWPDFESLFEARGGPKSCWCTAWRPITAKEKAGGGIARKRAMSDRVHGGVPIGLLGYLQNEPVAWCSIAPRQTYRKLGGAEIAEDAPSEVWSIVCFFVRRDIRGQGATEQLIDAALAYARAHGAKIVEAYPVDPGSPSYRFMGYVPAFEQAGFAHFGPAGSRRHVMRKAVPGTGGAHTLTGRVHPS